MRGRMLKGDVYWGEEYYEYKINRRIIIWRQIEIEGTCEIETRSAGSGVPTRRVSGGKLCWYCK